MALELKQSQKMSQHLVMTPQLQQAIKLLQLSHLELVDVLQEELQENPLLEEGSDEDPAPGESDDDREVEIDADLGAQDEEPNQQDIDWERYLEADGQTLPFGESLGVHGDEMPAFDATLSAAGSLAQHLRDQLQMSVLTSEQHSMGLFLIDAIGDDGYLPEDIVAASAEEWGVEASQVEDVLRVLQSFDPLGVGARSLRECLHIQLAAQGLAHGTAWRVVEDHLEDVQRRDLQTIVTRLGVPWDDVREAMRQIMHLQPRPGLALAEDKTKYIVPDVYVRKVGDSFVVIVNEEGLPRLKISPYYGSLLHDPKGSAKSYLQEKLRGATWLIRSIHMRQRTIARVMESIIEFQKEFFEKGPSFLKPLILKDVAESIAMHESTISRVTSNKYVHTAQGLYELKYFFNSAIKRPGAEMIGSESVREHIKKLIAAESEHDPISDQQLVALLGKSGIKIARRTVAKYREMMRIPTSTMRKKVF